MERIRKFLFENTNNKQTVIKNTFWLFVGEMGVRILKLAIFVYAARKLGVQEWGVFSYAIAIMATFAIISDIGINSVLIKKITSKNLDTEYISTGFILKLLLSIIASLGLLSLTLFLKNGNALKIIIPVMSLVLFIDSLREFGFTLNRAFEKMETEAMVKIITTSILVVISFIFIFYRKTALSFAYSYLISSIVGLIIMYIILKKSYLANIVSHFNKNLLYLIFKEAWPLAIVGVFGIIMTNIDTIILGWYKSIIDVGIYSVAQKPIQLIYVIPLLVSVAFLPIFSKLSSIDKDKMNLAINRAVSLSLIFAFPIAIGGILLGNQFIILLFGQQYIEAITIFKIMVITILVSAPGIILSNAIFVEGKQKKIAQAVIIGTIMNIILCILLIPHFRIYGAAVSTTISQIITNIFIIVSAKRISTIKLELNLKKIITATIIMAAIILIFRNITSFFIIVVISIISYFSTLLILKEENIKEIFKK